MKEFLLKQMELIDECKNILKKLLIATNEDHKYGRGFCSNYPNESLAKLEIMRFAYELEFQYIKYKKDIDDNPM